MYLVNFKVEPYFLFTNHSITVFFFNIINDKEPLGIVDLFKDYIGGRGQLWGPALNMSF